ncbi:MAG: COX15/CtaA family protein [Actinomycetota bacterium]|nr:COX15/CtaA family protein [Actinomycetota bacterium]
MDSVAPRDGGADMIDERRKPRNKHVPPEASLSRFRRLTEATIIATFVLVLIGGIVRVSDSGLGCGPAGSGTHGWPLCEGGVLPAASAESVIEYSHRITAGIVSVMIGLMVWRAWRQLKDHRWIVRGSIAAGLLVLVQAGLGGLTVEENLEEWLVAAHLGLAMLLLALLVILRRHASEPQSVGSSGSLALRTLSAVAATLILCTIVAGGLVAGTEGHGRADQPELGAHTACGQQFPGCIDQGLMPFGTGRLVDIQLTHRLFMYLASLAVIALVVVAIRERARSRSFLVLGALLVCQVVLGAINVWAGKHAGLIVGHLALGTLVWTTAVYATTTLMAVPAPLGRTLREAEAARAPA